MGAGTTESESADCETQSPFFLCMMILLRINSEIQSLMQEVSYKIYFSIILRSIFSPEW